MDGRARQNQKNSLKKQGTSTAQGGAQLNASRAKTTTFSTDAMPASAPAFGAAGGGKL
jgi:hypothetical protein